MYACMRLSSFISIRRKGTSLSRRVVRENGIDHFLKKRTKTLFLEVRKRKKKRNSEHAMLMWVIPISLIPLVNVLTEVVYVHSSVLFEVYVHSV